MKISTLAAALGVCCQALSGPAAAAEGACPGVDGSNVAALGQCILQQLCVEGIYDPPRSIALSGPAMRAYIDQELDVSMRHFRLDVRFRKRADAETGQCGYTGPSRFMFSLVAPASPTTLAVTFDPAWTY